MGRFARGSLLLAGWENFHDYPSISTISYGFVEIIHQRGEPWGPAQWKKRQIGMLYLAPSPWKSMKSYEILHLDDSAPLMFDHQLMSGKHRDHRFHRSPSLTSEWRPVVTTEDGNTSPWGFTKALFLRDINFKGGSSNFDMFMNFMTRVPLCGSQLQGQGCYYCARSLNFLHQIPHFVDNGAHANRPVS